MGENQPQPIAELIRGTLAATEKFNGEELAGYQRNQLEQLLRFSQAQAPFHKEQLAALFRKGGSID